MRVDWEEGKIRRDDTLSTYEAFEMTPHDADADANADTAAEPLIGAHGGCEGEQGEELETSVDESALVSPGLFIWTLTLCAGISGLLFGYE